LERKEKVGFLKPPVEKFPSGASRAIVKEVKCVALEVQTPEVRWGVLEFQAQFPTAPALVSTPYQEGVASLLVHQVNQSQFLPDGKALRKNSQAPFRADVYCVAFRAMISAILSPLHRHCHSRIQADSRADMLHPLLEIADDRRHDLLGLPPAGRVRTNMRADAPAKTKLAVITA
jgi:hypothetical protein